MFDSWTFFYKSQTCVAQPIIMLKLCEGDSYRPLAILQIYLFLKVINSLWVHVLLLGKKCIIIHWTICLINCFRSCFRFHFNVNFWLFKYILQWFSLISFIFPFFAENSWMWLITFKVTLFVWLTNIQWTFDWTIVPGGFACVTRGGVCKA